MNTCCTLEDQNRIMSDAIERIAAWNDSELEPVAMRMLARLALKEIRKHEQSEMEAKEVPCPDCYGGHFKPCNICGDTGVAVVVEGGKS